MVHLVIITMVHLIIITMVHLVIITMVHLVRSSDGFPGKAESSLANLEREVSTQIFS